MIEVGVRELKNGLSAYLRRVSTGERVRVTMRGRPVADLVPAGHEPGQDRIGALVATGQVAPASKPVPSRAPPLAEGPPVSDLILAEREDDR